MMKKGREKRENIKYEFQTSPKLSVRWLAMMNVGALCAGRSGGL
jgi:hypothetical protein